MKKFLFTILFTLLLLVPSTTLAADDTDKLYIDIEIMDNGAIKVKELAALRGSYNGRLREIDYKNIYAPSFDGSSASFSGSDIYNGSSMHDIKIGDISKKDLTFEKVYKVKNFYKEVSNASNGSYGFYTITERDNGYDFKIFAPDTYNTAFYIEYIVDDVVIVHNDVAEIGWNILGETYRENIKDLIVKIHLPEEDESMRVWLHGPLDGEVERTSDKLATIKYKSLGAYNAIDFRMIFSKDLVKNATKFSNVVATDKVLEVEKGLADKANEQRNQAKTIVIVVRTITILWYLAIIVTVIYVYNKYDKEIKVAFNNEYYRDFPGKYGPETLEYLMNKRITTKGFSASILEIIRKKAIDVIDVPTSDGKKKKYLLKKNPNPKEQLTKEEEIIFNLLINTIGNGEEVLLQDIKKYGNTLNNAKKLSEEYSKWLKDAKRQAKSYGFYQNLILKRILPCLISAAGYIIFIINVALNVDIALGVIALFTMIITTVYFITFTKRSSEGALQYKQWLAFKKFLKDFGLLDEKELPELILWEKYLVYATVLGCAKELEKEMKIKIENMEANNTISLDTTLDSRRINHVISHHIATDITNTMTKAVESSLSTIAGSASSSSGGFGGGASFGGGSFGGGGGGGRF